jgi:hypothetical protein
MSGQPVQQYVPPSPYAPPQPPPERKGVHPAIIIVVVVVAILFVMIIAALLWISAIDNIGSEPWEETDEFEDEVYIDQEGHFRYLLTDDWADEFQVNLTIQSLDGGPFDVYIMTWNQYANAYSNSSSGAFSAMFMWKNVTSVRDIVVIESPMEPLYLVVDNKRMAYVPDDADPEGIIQVRLDLVMILRIEGW